MSVVKEQDFYNKVYGFLCPSPAHGKFSLITISISVCVLCACMHLSMYVCVDMHTHIDMWKPEDSIEYNSSGDVSWGFSIPWSQTRQLGQPGNPSGPLTPTSHYWDCRHTNILYVFWASNSGPCVYKTCYLLQSHFSSPPLSIFLDIQGTQETIGQINSGKGQRGE